MTMWPLDWGKLLVIAGTMGAGLLLISRGETAEGVGMIGTTVGYVMGNGNLARKREEPVPAFRRREAEE